MSSYVTYVETICLLCTYTSRMLKQYVYYVLIRDVCPNNFFIMTSYVAFDRATERTSGYFLPSN